MDRIRRFVSCLLPKRRLKELAVLVEVRAERSAAAEVLRLINFERRGYDRNRARRNGWFAPKHLGCGRKAQPGIPMVKRSEIHVCYFCRNDKRLGSSGLGNAA